jgi:prepilin-type N-terminal cleavage/methylation domain-containing protein
MILAGVNTPKTTAPFMEGLMATSNGSQRGFTLVEIAIVLVIIGLLLGGILKGQEMITQAKIKNIINDFNGISAAVYSYQDRYRALPGDDSGAKGRWNTTAAWLPDADLSVNGNGQFTGTYEVPAAAAATASLETNLFWAHLRLAGFVPGATTWPAAGQQPNNAVNGIVGVQTSSVKIGFNANIICTSNLPDKVATAIDGQMDDGVPDKGQLRGELQTAPNQPTEGATAPAASYVETGTNQYLICKQF